jgi:hypothetical protein
MIRTSGHAIALVTRVFLKIGKENQTHLSVQKERKTGGMGCGGKKERESLLIPLIVIPSQRKIFINLVI